MLLPLLLNLEMFGGGPTIEPVIVGSIDYTAPPDRLHFTAEYDRLHFLTPPDRLHFKDENGDT